MTHKALIVWGKCPCHQFDRHAEAFAVVLRSHKFHVDITSDLDIFLDPEHLKHTALLVQLWHKAGGSDAQAKGMLEAVKGGMGFVGCHAGIIDTFPTSMEYRMMTGGQFISHPPGMVDYVVNIADQADEITRGVQDFKVHSEKYYMHTDPSNHVLATTAFTSVYASSEKGCVMPVAWKKKWGDGKVFYFSVGHKAEDFLDPSAAHIMTRGMLWAARGTPA